MNHVIKNFEDLNTNPTRNDALSIIEAGSIAVDTSLVVENTVVLENNILSIKGNKFNLGDYNRVFVIGFGKASSKAVKALEGVLGDKLDGGIVIDKNPTVCNIAQAYQGSHPLPSNGNVDITEKIVALAKDLNEKDLAIAVVSGGGSALLCWPLSELEQGKTLYKDFVSNGGTIEELNTLRKHTSEIKGGGLAKMLYPATVASLILCDVPGDHYEDTASGPTYFDKSTVEDAKKLIEKYEIKDAFTFNETPKDTKFFEKVVNIPFISNKEALEGMSNKAKELGYDVISLGAEMYCTPDVMLAEMVKNLKPKTVVIVGGELSLNLKKEGGVGGRNLFICGQAIDFITDEDAFISFASDGIDNRSVAAGAIVDVDSKNKIKEKNISPAEFLEKDMADELFTSIGDSIITGATGSNVSDLYMMLRK